MAADVTLPWKIQAYDDQTADVGDTVTFDFTSGHTVHIHPSGTCDTTDAVELGTTGPIEYTFVEEDAGKDIFFACDQSGHCDGGQIVKFTVSGTAAAPTDTTETSAPASAPTEEGSPPTDAGAPAESPTEEESPTDAGEPGEPAPTGYTKPEPAPTPTSDGAPASTPTASKSAPHESSLLLMAAMLLIPAVAAFFS